MNTFTVYCWSCMKRKVTNPGETCYPCVHKYPRHRTTKDMTLDELIRTQEAGTVPGDSYDKKHNRVPTPRGLIDGRGRLSY